MDERQYVRLREVAGLCGVSVDALRRWAHNDSIPLHTLENALVMDRRDLRMCLVRRGLEVPRELEQWPRVLIADDDQDMRQVADWLVHFAWQDAAVCTAGDGELARRMLLEFRPDLFVTDLRMPGETGEELCRLVRADPTLRHAKILVITGNDRCEVREELMAYVDGYLAKPFEPRELREIAVRLLGAGPAARPRAESPFLPDVIF